MAHGLQGWHLEVAGQHALADLAPPPQPVGCLTFRRMALGTLMGDGGENKKTLGAA
jgi:hypothetical protein